MKLQISSDVVVVQSHEELFETVLVALQGQLISVVPSSRKPRLVYRDKQMMALGTSRFSCSESQGAASRTAGRAAACISAAVAPPVIAAAGLFAERGFPGGA